MDNFERYSRQILFEGIGREGQDHLSQSSAVIIGCGALGAVQAETLARAGVGRLTVVDRDFVEESNLQRQIMFEESDAIERLPKAIAAANRLRRVNLGITIDPVVADVNFENIEDIIRGADVVLDGADNFETRFLINDAAVKLAIPWVYGAAVGSYGVTMTVLPGASPCLRCVMDVMPDPGSADTCDTAGVIMPAVSIVASIQAAEAIKIMTGNRDKLHHSIFGIDVWNFQVNRVDLSAMTDRSGCPACGLGQYEYLRGGRRQLATTLCGRDAVQIAGAHGSELDLASLSRRLRSLGEVAFNEFLLRFKVDGYDMTVFRDARSIIRGTSDPVVARNLYARYIGV
ncbi:MAG TPA: ThiF family adenylyltransferase [Blastocatellia bacterium]|nr:ThiF family adenylyltransferase [Blastocatellia bacterium]